MSAEPRHHFVEANRLRHHLVEWPGEGPVVLLCHGFLEHARVWDFVAPSLVAAGFHPYALDWRGHGDSEWVGRGGYYHFADYVADVAGIVRWLGGRVAVVAHSMGAAAALLYAGTEPGRVSALVLVDATGPPDSDPATAPERYRTWLADLERLTARDRPPVTLAEATLRLLERFPAFGPDVARHLALHGTRAGGRGRVWSFDPRHQSGSPQPYYVRQARAFWEAITCPVLYVGGAESPVRLFAADVDERLRILRAERVDIPGCGHHPHLEAPEAFAGHVGSFLGRHACTA